MTPEELARLAGLLLSLALIYVPVLAPWYDGLTTKQKPLVFVGLLLLAGLLSLGAACLNLSIGILIAMACTKAGTMELVNVFITAAITGAGTYVTVGKLRPEYARTKKFDSRPPKLG